MIRNTPPQIRFESVTVPNPGRLTLEQASEKLRGLTLVSVLPDRSKPRELHLPIDRIFRIFPGIPPEKGKGEAFADFMTRDLTTKEIKGWFRTGSRQETTPASTETDIEHPEWLELVPDLNEIHAMAYLWCNELSKIPPKNLPRSERPAIGLLQRLPEHPTGNPDHDRARAMVLDSTAKKFWNVITQSTAQAIAAQETPED